MKTIGIILLATNIYFLLGLRFIKKFMYHYRGDALINFYVFSDTKIKDYLPKDFANVRHYDANNENWLDGTNSKFKNILSIKKDLKECDYLYYFDADTTVYGQFNENFLIGDTVAGIHCNNSYEPIKPFDRNVNSAAYVPLESNLEQIYYYGAFFGGKTSNVLKYVKEFRKGQIQDQKIGYEPVWNDESYINKYFHFNKPSLAIKPCAFGNIFGVSDKGGLPDTRDVKQKIEPGALKALAENKNKLFNFVDGKIKIEKEDFLFHGNFGSTQH